MIDVLDLTLGGKIVGNAPNVIEALELIMCMYENNKHQYTYTCLDNDVDVVLPSNLNVSS